MPIPTPASHKAMLFLSRVSSIVLAVLLVTTIFGMADMFIRSQILQAQQDNGNFHIGVRDITDDEAALIAKRPGIKATARYGVLNYRGEDGYTLSGKTAILAGCDEAWVTELLVDNIVEGNFPQTETEAMITESANEQLGLQIGDTIMIDDPTGEKLQYTISGFCQNTSKTMSEDSYGIFITTDAFRSLFTNASSDQLTDYNSMLYIQFENSWNIRQEIIDLKADCGLSDEQVSENTKLIGLYGQGSSSFMMQIYTVAAFLFVLVLFAGIMMIASSLNSNVSQRTEFFGLMRCIGATPKQVMRMVRKEALRWCRFAIPVGVVTGIVIIWILCAVLRVLSPEYFGEMPAFGVSIPSIFAGIIVGLLTVLLAARSPAKKAAKVSPLAAVSGNTSSFKPAKKAANTKLFKVDTALGIHHAKASKKNLILMTASFAFSIILFLAFSVTVDFMHSSLTPLRPWTSDLSIISADNSCSVDNGLLKKIQENSAVKAVYGRMAAYDVPATVNGKQKKVDLVSYEQHQFEWAKDYLLEGSLDSVQNQTYTGLVVYEPENTIEMGNTVTLDIGGQTSKIQISGTLSASSFTNDNNTGIIICSEDTFRQLTGESNYTILDMQLTKNAMDEDVNEIKQMAGTSYTISDDRMSNSSVIGTYYCFWLFVYGFLVLIAMITAFNIINSLAMSVSSRTKQYGTFRAIGLSIRQLKKMIVAEACMYALMGSIIGTVVGLLCNKVLFKILITSHWGTAWAVPWTEIGIILLVIILSVVLAIFGPIRKIQKMSIVDTISTQ